MSEGEPKAINDSLQREVLSLRAQVAELQRAAARHEETEEMFLAEREELLREAERAAHFGTWSWDIESGKVRWSDEMFRILGLDPTRDTPSVERFFAAVHSEDRASAQETADRARKDGVLPMVDCRIVRPDGTIRHTTTLGTYLFDSEGNPRRMVGGLLDRTRQLQDEATLRRTLTLLEEAQSFAQLGSWRFEPESGKVEWSREFQKIAGIPPDAPAKPETFLARIVAEDRDRFIKGYQRVLRAPRPGEISGRLVRPDGSMRHVRLRGALVQGEQGKSELRGTMLDVTDQVKLREDLAHSQKMEAVGRLAGGIAHDFNNLLTVITGNLEILGEEIGTRPELDECLRALDSAANMTRRLLAFGRKAQLSLQLVDPNELVRSTMSLMQRLVGDQVILGVKLAPSLPKVRVDNLEMERALVNLVVNARDVMKEGGTVEITTRERRTVEGGHWVELSVADQGPGIPQSERSHIFEPFYSTRQDSGGTGLGLATVLGTAQQHGGTVEVSDAESRGSVFTIVLPAVTSETIHPPERPKSVIPRTGPRPLSLLVVDDEWSVATVTQRMLEARGHTVHVATDGKQARRVFGERGGDFDLIVCDVVMPEVRGPDLIASLNSAGHTPPVLFISGYNEEATRDDFNYPTLSKPFSSVQLERAIFSVLWDEPSASGEFEKRPGQTPVDATKKS